MADMQPNGAEQQLNWKNLMEPPRKIFPAKYSHHSRKTTQNKENKKRMFLCALNEKKRWTAQSIQNSKFQFSSFLISVVISFTIFQILLFSFTLKAFIYFIHMWERKQSLKCTLELAVPERWMHRKKEILILRKSLKIPLRSLFLVTWHTYRLRL